MVDEFEAKWQGGEVVGWEDQGVAKVKVINVSSVIDLDAFHDVDDLETVGPERLKQALNSLGLKCGGTARQRAERLYKLKGRTLEDIDASLFAKGAIVMFKSGFEGVSQVWTLQEGQRKGRNKNLLDLRLH